MRTSREGADTIHRYGRNFKGWVGSMNFWVLHRQRTKGSAQIPVQPVPAVTHRLLRNRLPRALYNRLHILIRRSELVFEREYVFLGSLLSFPDGPEGRPGAIQKHG